jgi:general L-amino acid transport system permease protein
MSQTTNQTGGRRPMAPAGPARRRWRRKIIAGLQQAALLAAIAGVFIWLAFNVAANLQTFGLSSGFDFLGREAGFAISFSLIEVSEASSYGRLFVASVLNTLLVAIVALILATLLGVLIGVASMLPSGPFRHFSRIYVEAMRNLPLLLVLIFIQTVVLRTLPVVKQALSPGGGFFFSNRGIYTPAPLTGPGTNTALGLVLAAAFLLALAIWTRPRVPVTQARQTVLPIGALAGVALCLTIAATLVQWEYPVLKGFDFRGGLKVMPEFVALVAALVLYNASFIAEIVRAGIQDIDRGQIEAARALGLRNGFITSRIVLPQALRLMLPPITNQLIHLVKASSLATVVGFPDIVSVFLGTALNQTGRAVEIVLMTSAVYLAISLALGAGSAALNRRATLVGR